MKKTKQKFGIGDAVIISSALLLVSVLFDWVVARFLLGIFGLYSFALFFAGIVVGCLVKFKNRISVNKTYLYGSLALSAAVFTALHILFTQKEINTSIGDYLTECYSSFVSPGGILFAVPAYFFFISCGGVLGSVMVLSSVSIICMVLIFNKIVVHIDENKVLSQVQNTEEKEPDDFLIEPDDLQKSVEAKYKENLERTSRKNLDKNKSILGLDKLPPPPAKPKLTPYAINAMTTSVAAGSVTAYASNVFQPNMYAPNGPTINPSPQPSFQPPDDNGIKNFDTNTEYSFAQERNPDRRRPNVVSPAKFEQTEISPDILPPRQSRPVRSHKYIKPQIDIIKTESSDLSGFNEEIVSKKIALEELFVQNRVGARIDNFVVAPAVTRFEIVLDTGTRVSGVERLESDIQYVLGTDKTRMESPIQGKNAIGIEVPNKDVGAVSIKDLLKSREFLMHSSPLAICLGKDLNNNPVIADLAKMPHLLVAGTTGSGKSICIKSILTSLLFKTGPDDLRLLLVDMKHVELNIYNNLPHMLIPQSITDAAKAINALKWLVKEMQRRYEMLAANGLSSIVHYHSLPDYQNGTLEKLPYIVMVIDEAADLMATNRKEVDEQIKRLASLARAAGIHIILATQRPSVDVISGVIKANIGIRIAFRVLSAVDSSTILDTKGAETLVGRGDMLYKNEFGVQRLQGCYLEDSEAREIISFVRDKNPSNFDSELEDIILNGESVNAVTTFDSSGRPIKGIEDQDPYFVQVLKYAVRAGNKKNTISISELQRIFSIGFGRSGKIVEQLAAAGYLSNEGDGRPRTVLISRAEVENLYGSID
ncbi:MAG: DUF87 domain-containing protein [Christensenellaceae bacterium]|jgi:S-DNA-T family DNA segregation ATPase FtsK/SpoIIIE|nr:DUF87 domain-containing protein [Christensenellaceae bacterium]